jgi:hypothetical protein
MAGMPLRQCAAPEASRDKLVMSFFFITVNPQKSVKMIPDASKA